MTSIPGFPGIQNTRRLGLPSTAGGRVHETPGIEGFFNAVGPIAQSTTPQMFTPYDPDRALLGLTNEDLTITCRIGSKSEVAAGVGYALLPRTSYFLDNAQGELWMCSDSGTPLVSGLKGMVRRVA